MTSHPITSDTNDASDATERDPQPGPEERLRAALAEAHQIREQLDAATHAKDHFLAALSHELRTPLTPILIAVQALEFRGDLPVGVRDMLAVIHRNVRIEANVIDDLLDVTKLRVGQLPRVREPVDLHEVVRDAIAICEPDMHAAGQNLTVALRARRHRTLGDGPRLQKAVWNVVRNAAKFTPRGGSIGVRTRNANGAFLLIVADNGIGIQPETLKSIFETFSHGNETIARRYGGLGLGLAIAKATVDAHGGTLSAASGGPDRGTTVRAQLPLEA